MHITVEIVAGACGLGTTLQAHSSDGRNVTLEVESECPRVAALGAELTCLDAFEQVLLKPLVETTPALLSARHKLHTTCPVPIGVLKAVEASAGLALPAPCTVTLKRTE